MADSTLSTRFSRRSMLAGGIAMTAVPVAVTPSAAGPAPLDNRHPDADLLRRTAAAHDCLADYLRADAFCLRLHRGLRGHPDFPEGMPCGPEEGARWDALMERTGVMAADAHCDRLYERYEAALVTAFAVPARTAAGVHGKLLLAVTAVKQAQSALLDKVDCAYLDNALIDLGRLTAGGAGCRAGRRAPPFPWT